MGITNYSQATRVLLRQLDKSTNGNLFINFVTSFRALKVRPGDIIAVTYAKGGISANSVPGCEDVPGDEFRVRKHSGANSR